MYEYAISGRGYFEGEVKKVGRAKAIVVKFEWEEGDKVVVIREGKVEKMELIDVKKEGVK